MLSRRRRAWKPSEPWATSSEQRDLRSVTTWPGSVVRLNERRLWLGAPVSPDEAGLTIFRAYPGSWWIAT